MTRDISFDFFASCPLGLEHPLAEELRAMRLPRVRPARAGVSFAGSLADGYRACLWSRVASRILTPLARFEIRSADDLYAAVREIEWERHLDPSKTLAVDFAGTGSGIQDTRFGGVRVKDAVVDRLRDLTGDRPSVRVDRPDVRLNVRLREGKVTLSLDLSGEPLHRRGYRAEGGVTAPLKENVAAGVLLLAGWPKIAEDGGALVDPMCGSGTLLVEGAWMAADVAPGSMRDYWGFVGWAGHDADAWDDLLAEADERAEAGLATLPAIVGSDVDANAIRVAEAEVARAGLRGRVSLEVRDASEAAAPTGWERGLVATNPPWGERLGEREALGELYETLGTRLHEAFPGWRAAVLTSDAGLANRMGAGTATRNDFRNGPLEVSAWVFETSRAGAGGADATRRGHAERGVGHGERRGLDLGPHARRDEAAERPLPPVVLGDGAEMLGNRLRKNLRHLGKWARREGVTCWRVYDADLPEYAVAVDIYEGAGPDEGRRWAHVAEYEAPATIDPDAALRRLAEAVAVIPDALGIPAEDVVLKRRRRQRGSAQYERLGERELHEVAEGGLRFLVDLHGQLDTGLFLDHRPTRARLRELASGARFLNLFAYTGAVTVYAAAGGAASTTTVDMSRTYTDWARRNLELNGFATDATTTAPAGGAPGGSRANELVTEDVLSWLETMSSAPKSTRRTFDLIFVDPPTFSNSKRMSGVWDVQRDHVSLLRACGELLADDGLIVFSNNFRRFKMDVANLGALIAEDITRATVPPDFARNPRIHNTWLVRKAGASAASGGASPASGSVPHGSGGSAR